MTAIIRAHFLLVLAIWLSSSAWSQSPATSGPNNSAPVAGCPPTYKSCGEEWAGTRSSEGRSQSIVLHATFSKSGDKGTVDLPDFGALDIPASRLAMDRGKVHFELVGDFSTTFFDGSASGDVLRGSWKEGERTGSFELKRSNGSRKNFHEKDVTFQNGDVRLAGTLLIPDRPAPAPAIVFVQGSGPEMRYASRFLSEFFVKRGVAALIYDKRGTGGSTGDWKHSSFEDLAADVVASVNFLKACPGIDSSRIGLMGSSQGAWVAPMAGLRIPGLAFVIAKSGPPVSPEKQELGRVAAQMQAEGDSSADITEALALYSRAIAYARTGQGWDALAHEIAADSQQRWTMFDADTPKDYWFFDQIRSDFDHDPIVVLQQLKSPLLVIFGGRDEDGPPLQESLGPLLEAMRAGGKTSELDIFPNAGHDLRVEPGEGQAWDFPRFAPGYLDWLVTWVKLQTQ